MKKIILFCMLWGTFLMGGSKAVYTLDFSKQKDGDATAWLQAKGFQFLLDSKALNLHFDNGNLAFEPKG
jgi:hypothetical protein